MIRVGEGGDAALRLGDLRALGEGFPLRGRFLVDDARGEREADGIPAPGTLWMSRAGADQLGARIGDAVSIGQSRLTLAALVVQEPDAAMDRSEEHTSELQSLMRISYAVFCLKKKNYTHQITTSVHTYQSLSFLYNANS